MADDSIRMFDELSSLGYAAGIVLKGTWKNQEEIYDHLSREFTGNNMRMLTPSQTHSSRIAIIEEDHSLHNPSADGTISSSENLCLTVSTADCIPMLMVERSTGFFGAIHIGWRGFAGGIVEELFNLSGHFKPNPEDMYFHLGPSIRNCCFEVGDEVAVLFDDPFITRGDNKFSIDLPGALVNKLISFGVREINIGGSPDCTSCLSERYYSYRRDGRAPIQMVSFISKL